ncbi:MAG TPA: siroheme synthase [Sphingomonadaceae bacterium]|nr:siroheme synthase [Sphingomonadaceae bacterium]
MRSLPLFHRIAGKTVIVLGEGPLAEPKKRLVERAGGVVVGEDDSEARLAFVALEEPEEAVARLKARGVLVNVVDRPELCDFTTPSILERDPVLVAVGTSGASAGLAKHLRLRLEALLPHSLGTLATRLESMRDALKQRLPNPTDRRQALDRALGSGGMLDPLDPHAPDRIGEWLEGAEAGDGSRRAILLLTSDDPGDLTLRQAGLLGAADAVLHEPGIPAAILAQARADAARFVLPFEGELPKGLTVELRRG